MICSNIILVFFLFSITISTVHCANSCCRKDVFRKTSDLCEDGNAIIIPKCAGYQSTLNNAYTFMSGYIIRNDSLGEYLDDYIGGFIVRTPNFCLGERKLYSGKVQSIAVICSTDRIFYREMKSKIDESDTSKNFISLWMDIPTIMNFLSMFLLALTFYIYYLVIPSRQIEDNCLLNVTACSCLAHAFFLYDIFNSQGLLPDMCITHLYAMYFFILSRYAWYALFMYSVWKKFKFGLPLDENAVQKQFRMVGFGAPTFIIILANIHAHSNKLTTEFSLEDDCAVHEILMGEIYIHGPIVLAIGLNCYFWKDLATHVETAAVKTMEDELNKKKIRSLLTVNRRLFFVLGLPFLLYVIIYGMTQFFVNTVLFIVFLYMDNIFSTLGIFIAIVLVMLRARVWKCIIHKYENIQLLQKWQPFDEEESSSDVTKTYSSPA